MRHLLDPLAVGSGETACDGDDQAGLLDHEVVGGPQGAALVSLQVAHTSLRQVGEERQGLSFVRRDAAQVGVRLELAIQGRPAKQAPLQADARWQWGEQGVQARRDGFVGTRLGNDLEAKADRLVVEKQACLGVVLVIGQYLVQAIQASDLVGRFDRLGGRADVRGVAQDALVPELRGGLAQFGPGCMHVESLGGATQSLGGPASAGVAVAETGGSTGKGRAPSRLPGFAAGSTAPSTAPDELGGRTGR